MNRLRSRQLILIGITIVVGLFSRKASLGLPLWIGDSLYAMLFYWGVGLFFPKQNPLSISLVALGLCFAVEFAQLLQWDWLVALRHNRLGALILGRGFLWSDLAAYSAGCLAAFLFECLLLSKRPKSTTPRI